MEAHRRAVLRAAAGLLATALALVVGGCTATDDDRPPATIEERGEALFVGETFDGNGRACSSCHELDQFGTIRPEFVRERFEADPEGPLFRAIDSDHGLGLSYGRLKSHATIRVLVDLPTHEATGLSVRKCDDPASTRAALNRGIPSVFNVALEDRLMHDGREGDDLAAQALAAVRSHAEPGREPTQEELEALAAFQQSLFSHEAVRRYFQTGEAIELPAGTTESEKRGRVFFEPDRECGQCHSGPMLNRTSEFHPLVIHSRFESALVGGGPLQPNERYRWCFVDPATDQVVPGPAGVPEVFPEPRHDPGLAIIPGSTEFLLPEDSMAAIPEEFVDGSRAVIPNEILAGVAGGPLYKIPTLWGTPDTAPYFHDNSARTLEEVLDQYNFFFAAIPENMALGCDREGPDCLDEQDKIDILNFMQLLAFEPAVSN